MSDLEITMAIQKFAKEDDLYSKEIANLLSEGGIDRLISQYKNISRRLDSISSENRELKTHIAELEAELEGKERPLKTEIDTSTPLDCANSLIHHLTHLDAFLIAPERDVQTFTIDGLEQIAEHLLVYCKHNKEV